MLYDNVIAFIIDAIFPIDVKGHFHEKTSSFLWFTFVKRCNRNCPFFENLHGLYGLCTKTGLLRRLNSKCIVEDDSKGLGIMPSPGSEENGKEVGGCG